MTEIMIFSIKAQVYTLDSTTTSWSPSTFSVVPVSFYCEPTSRRTRIIAMENSEAKVNSIILADMEFQRPSETFGQWMDTMSDQVYGLNFTSKTDAENFEKQFNDVISQQSQPQTQTTTTQPQQTQQSRTLQIQESHKNDDAERLRREIGELKVKIADKDAEIAKRAADSSSKGGATANLSQKIETLTAQIKTMNAENDQYKNQLASLKTVAANYEQTETKIRQAQTDLEKLKNASKQNGNNLELWQKQLATLQKENADLKAKFQKMMDFQKSMSSVFS